MVVKRMDFDGVVTLVGKDGKNIECEVLFTHEEDGHKYLVYTDKTLYNNEILRTYVSELVEKDGESKLLEVNDIGLLRKIQDRLDELTPELIEEKRKLSEENGD